MKTKFDFPLKPYNQFGVEVQAEFFAQPKTVEDVKELVDDAEFKDKKKLVLGGGNNILFVNDFKGLVIKPEIKGRIIYQKNDHQIFIRVGAAEDWDKFVRWTVEMNWGGIENLINIPGTVGGAVSQGIGAYGQEVAEVVEKVEAVDLENGDVKIFDNKNCQFGYHTSAFKEKFKNKFLITHVWFRLTPVSVGYKLNYDYISLRKELEKVNKPYTLKEVMEAVVRQREKNLPDLDSYGTCGCFFTNPVISKEKYEELLKKLPDLTAYPVNKNNKLVKIPAGKLIDELVWKGRWQENVGVSEKHALCIVTRRQASGKEILDLAEKIKQDVLDTYGVELEFEVNIV